MNRMTHRLFFVACCGCCLAIASTTLRAQNSPGRDLSNPGSPPNSPPTPVDSQSASVGQNPSLVDSQGPIEPLVRGPIHEGFAEMVRLTPQPIPPVAGEPPQPINESPADIRPDNPNAEWLPGYWGWDGDSKQFIWISGTWRLPPPGTRWVPGYWANSPSGSQRVPGFWVPAETEQVSYLPAPPPYEDKGVDPDSPPSPDVFRVPGNWAFTNGKYGWDPGYWARMVQGWMWIAAHYQWTPQGYVFVDGRWDYPLNERGMLFTPIAFQSPVYQTAGFAYSPAYLIDTAALADNLFVNPTFQDYYFGDYYGNQYAQAGILPWYSVGTGAYLYDPIFTYQGWFDRRRNPHWRDDLRRRYDGFVRNPAARPPRTWRDEQRLARAGGVGGIKYRPLVTPVSQALRDNRTGRRYVPLNENQRREARQNSDLRRRLAVDRGQLERPAPSARPTGRPNPTAPGRTFRLPPMHTAATRPAPEERERNERMPTTKQGGEPIREARPEPRREARPNTEVRRPTPAAQQERVPHTEPRANMPPRRPERVATPPRTAPPVRRPPAAPRTEKRP
jgi:hypothetical protein